MPSKILKVLDHRHKKTLYVTHVERVTIIRDTTYGCLLRFGHQSDPTASIGVHNALYMKRAVQELAEEPLAFIKLDYVQEATEGYRKRMYINVANILAVRETPILEGEVTSPGTTIHILGRHDEVLVRADVQTVMPQIRRALDRLDQDNDTALCCDQPADDDAGGDDN